MRYFTKGNLVVACTLACVCPASASPTISGSYIFRQTIICQPFTGEASRAEHDMGRAVFNASSHQVAIKGFAVFGPVAEKSPRPTHEPVNKTFSYSNTASTFTIGKDTYNVLYAKLTNGKAGEFYFQAVTNGHCVVQGSAVQQ
jgi:hypothetical protein